MRHDNGVYRPVHRPVKPDYLIFVNSFFGLEISRDLPPTCAPVGPLLSPTYPALDVECERFLSRHKNVMYIALGTHIVLTNKDAVKVVNGILRLIQEDSIDGVIWAISQDGRRGLDRSQSFNGKFNIEMGGLLDIEHPDIFFRSFVPQRAILEHESVKFYFTHGGGSSANEGLYHGKPMISMGFFADQIANTTRLVEGGVAESMSKFHFTSDELYEKAREILDAGEDGVYQRNVLRLKRIAHVASHRKNHAADLVEEILYDNELRLTDEGNRELRPMHLQTADMRMPAYKAKNWDLYAIGVLALSTLVGTMGIAGHLIWIHRGRVSERARGTVFGTYRFLKGVLSK